MCNVEIKAKIHNFDDFLAKAIAISDKNPPPKVINMIDTFYKVNSGRLKLREYPGHEEARVSELVHYHREDSTGAKLSRYSKVPVPDPAGLGAILADSLGVIGQVKKVRHLLMSGQTRIHVDRVHNLGDFMELEVMLTDSDSVEAGQMIAQQLMKQLGVAEADLLAGAYMDMLLELNSG
ncbi:hypothetical protein BOX15_Mlig003380g2 [Macrostomum lignano]|uniref:CYTH domain-containing protein n=1 Tax=Macrostomum lignano TaxID=282301 RepID=A0A267H601_9PLAT|nr:hypothetical protein BOX15_Mlig003380g2 [Macrostomum lignano]